jgi:hypothetical protein
MTETEFLYHYTKIYHSQIVKAVLLIENWTDKNCDVKYAKYMQEYIRIKNEIYNPATPDTIITEALAKRRTEQLLSAYNSLFKHVRDGLTEVKGPLAREKIIALRDRLNRYTLRDDVNFDFLREVRKIEEEEY